MLTADRTQEILQELESKNKQYLAQAKEGVFPSSEKQKEHLDAVMDMYTLLSSMQSDTHVYDVLEEYRGILTFKLGRAERLVDATYDVFQELECSRRRLSNG